MNDSLVDSSYFVLCMPFSAFQEQGLETVLLSYKTISIFPAFLFIIFRLITVTFYILKCILGKEKVLMPFDASTNKSSVVRL